jgi:ATP-dependent Lon protease
MEFSIMLAQNKLPEEEVQLHIITWNSKEYLPDSELNFQELLTSLSEMGIKLTYEYQDLHDRHIVSNTGWRIQLGRGLDIFEPREGRLNPAEYYQERRNCKNCEIIIMKL